MLNAGDSINYILNHLGNVSLQRVYLLSVGSKIFYKEVMHLESRIFAHHVHWSMDSIPSNRNNWTMFSYNVHGVQDIMDVFDSHYSWSIDISSVKEQCAVRINIPSKDFWMGYSLGPAYQFTKGTDKHIEESFLKHRIQGSKRLGERWFMDLDLDFGMSRPQPQKIIQEKIQNGGIVSAILNGELNRKLLDDSRGDNSIARCKNGSG
jgi:hypothetical protein